MNLEMECPSHISVAAFDGFQSEGTILIGHE